MSKHWIQTYTGRKVYPLALRPEDVDIDDIAHALAHQCRFAGHVRYFYSVAEHSVHVSNHLPPGEALWGLLHDAAEAYLIDLPRPIKKAARDAGITFFDAAEERAMHAICVRFGLPLEMPDSVKDMDNILCVTEAVRLKSPLVDGWRHSPDNGYSPLGIGLPCWSPSQARWHFHKSFEELFYGP